MGQDITEARKVKVHHVMCEELKRVVNRITKIIPSIESARPGCNSGIQALCALSLAVDKANLQLKNCTESSKLYLAVRGESIQLTFEKLSKELDICLSKIQDMVPQPLAAEISDIINDLRDSKFELDSSEKEAGRTLISLLKQDKSATDSTGSSELEAFQIAAQLLKIKSQTSILIERRSIKKILDKVNDAESGNKGQLGKASDMGNRKKDVLKNLLHLLRKYENLLGCEPSEAVLSQQISSPSIIASARNSCHPDQPAGPPHLQFHVGSALGEAPNKECSSDGPLEELMCPISSELMSDPVVIASGVTYERIWIAKWFAEGHDTCPKTLIKLPHLCLTPNLCVKELIVNWCRKHNYTLPDPCSEPVPASFTPDTTLCCTSNDNVPENLEDRAFYGEESGNCASENDISSTLTSSSRGSKVLDPSVTGTTKSIQNGPSKMSSRTWSDNSERCPSLEDLNHEKYSNFPFELATLPSESHCKALEEVKMVFKSNEEASYSASPEAFVQVILAFLIDARDCSDIKSQKIGAQILLTFLSNSRIHMPALNEDAFLLLASFLESEIFEEALAIMQILSSHDCCKSEIMASGVLPSIIKVLDSQVKEFLLQAVEILLNLSSYSCIKSDVVSTGCISKLFPLLGNAEFAENCSRILQNLCDEEEARVAIAETNGCIASLVKIIDNGTRADQENSVSVLLSLCSNNSKCCHLVMNEDGIPPLISLSINGSSEGKEKAMKLLLLLRDLRNEDSVQSSFSQAGFDPELPQEAGSLCQEKRPTSSVSMFSKRIKNFLEARLFSSKWESNDRSKASTRKNCHI